MADGSYRLPAVSPSAGGYYAWRVAVDGTDTSLPATACGAVTKVQGVATTSVGGVPGTAQVNQLVQVQVTVAGMPFPAQADATIALFGPISSQANACSINLVDRRSWKVQGNGTFASPTIQVLAPGTYAWQSSISSGDLWLGSESPCLAPGSLMTVQ